MKLSKEQQLLQTIVKKAWDDEAFKQELIANPVSAIEKLAGQQIKLPKGKSIVVQDQTDESVIYLNIPAEPAKYDTELNQEQLDTITGGGKPVGPILIDPSASLKNLFDLV